MRENHYAISCIVLKISYVFNKQDTHNASYIQNVVQAKGLQRQSCK